MGQSKIQVTPIANHVVVEVDKQFNDTLETESGFKLFIDTTWKPAQYVRIFGTVMSIPLRGTNRYSVENGKIEPDVQVGDKIYFHYNVLMNKENYLEDNKWFIPYYHIFCAVRNKKILMIGGWVLVKPIIEKKDKQGRFFIPEFSKKKKINNFGILKHIGTPLKDQPVLGIKEGSYVYFSEMDCFENEIEGETYYCMQQEDLLLTSTTSPTQKVIEGLVQEQI
jgi:co-chaperonin GroES (HSP10)